MYDAASRRVDFLLTFQIENGRYALPLSSLIRVVRVPEITLLPQAPPIVDGVINVAGRIVPVISLRRRFGLPEKETALSDRVLIADTGRRVVALLADSVGAVVEPAEQKVVPAKEIVPGVGRIEGVVILDDGIVLIHDLDQCLSLEEERLIDEALSVPTRERE